MTIRIRASVAISSALLLALPVAACARSIRLPPLELVISKSDAIFLGTVKGFEISKTSNSFGGRSNLLVRITARIAPGEVWKSSGPLNEEVSVSYQDVDTWGPVLNIFEKGKDFLFLVSRSTSNSKAFATFSLGWGIFPVVDGNVRNGLEVIAVPTYRDFVGLSLSTTTSKEDWRKFVEILAESTGVDDFEQARGAMRLIAAQPNLAVAEEMYIKGLRSKSGDVANSSICRLIAIKSDKAFQSLMDLYFDLKRTKRWEDYSDSYVLPSHFNSCMLNDREFGRELARKIRREYPAEKELYDSIELFDKSE